jgi:2',3'-cyclic-nucleotide 2'-phosphodiesterase (5'-nucleotidase family)
LYNQGESFLIYLLLIFVYKGGKATTLIYYNPFQVSVLLSLRQSPSNNMLWSRDVILLLLSLRTFSNGFPLPLPTTNGSLEDTRQSSSITIVHTNDIHAHMAQFNALGNDCSAHEIASNKCYGGASRIISLVQQVREAKKNVYLMDGGDQFQGTMFYKYYKGNVTHRFMNELDYDVGTVGNHEVR